MQTLIVSVGESASQNPAFWGNRGYPAQRRPFLHIPARVLLVDDHPAARRTARAVVHDMGMNVAVVCGEAENGKRALEKVRRLEPDIVLLDIGLPEVDAVHAAYQIPRLPPYAKILFF